MLARHHASYLSILRLARLTGTPMPYFESIGLPRLPLLEKGLEEFIVQTKGLR